MKYNNKKEYNKLLLRKEWKEFRKTILDRDSNKCVKCGSTKILQAHHIKYIENRYPWEYELQELVTLCKVCHKKEHAYIANSNLPIGKEVWLPGAEFQKRYPQSWKWLRQNTTDLEYRAAVALSEMAKAYTNSLEPLNDATIIPDLVQILGIGKNMIPITLHKLWKLGVYAKFEVYDKSKPYTKYWILNPFLSYNGSLIDSDIARLFKGTYIAMAYQNIPFTLILN